MIDLNVFYSPEEQARFPEQQKRAIELYQKRCCPCCGERLMLWEIMALLLGSGVPYSVEAIHSDGTRTVIDELAFKPQTMYTEIPGEAEIAFRRGYTWTRQKQEQKP